MGSQGDGPTREAGEADDVPSNGARHVCGRIGPGGIEGPPSEAGLEQAWTPNAGATAEEWARWLLR